MWMVLYYIDYTLKSVKKVVKPPVLCFLSAHILLVLSLLMMLRFSIVNVWFQWYGADETWCTDLLTRGLNRRRHPIFLQMPRKNRLISLCILAYTTGLTQEFKTVTFGRIRYKEIRCFAMLGVSRFGATRIRIIWTIWSMANGSVNTRYMHTMMVNIRTTFLFSNLICCSTTWALSWCNSPYRSCLVILM